MRSTVMLKTTSLLAVLAVAAIGAPAAQAKSQHKYNSKIQSTTLSTAGGYPGTGGTAVLMGTWTTPQYGEGAIIDHAVITGHPDDRTFEFKGTEVLYVAKGTFKNAFSGKAVFQDDGSQRLTVTGKFVGGTGAYRGAKGHFSFSGSTAPGGLVVAGKSSGTITY
jgi:hypothetical protein